MNTIYTALNLLFYLPFHSLILSCKYYLLTLSITYTTANDFILFFSFSVYSPYSKSCTLPILSELIIFTSHSSTQVSLVF